MLFFEGKVGGKFMALTGPQGDVYFAYPEDSPFAGGPSLNLAESPDALHWKPLDPPGVRARKGSTSGMKVVGGTQPLSTERGRLLLYHVVVSGGKVGNCRTFRSLLELEDHSRVLPTERDQTILNDKSTPNQQ